MYKFIPVVFVMIALGVFFAVDYRSYSQRHEVEVASLDSGHAMDLHTESDTTEGSYLGHLLAKVGLGQASVTLDSTKEARLALRNADARSFLPEPNNEEEILIGWERLHWDAHYSAAFGWPDGVSNTPDAKTKKRLHSDVAIYLKGRTSVMVQVEFAEPTEVLAKRLKQSYWVVKTGRDLERLKEGRPRASYFWTNLKETSGGYGVQYAKDVAHFKAYDGVHFLRAGNTKDRRDLEIKYFFASLGGGVVIKVRALGSDAKVSEILELIDYQSLNQMQSLPNPLIADGLGEFLIDTPETWLASHSSETSEGHGQSSDGKAHESHGDSHAAVKQLPKVHKGGIWSQSCTSFGNGKHCKVKSEQPAAH